MIRPLFVLFFLAVALALGGCITSQSPAGAPVPGTDPLEALLAPAPWPAEAIRDAPTLDLDALAQAIHARVNAVRAERDLQPLTWAAPLAPVALAHGRDMAAHAYFGHTNLDGEDASARAQRAGLSCRQLTGTSVLEGIGENLFLTHRYAEYRVDRDAHGRPRYAFAWKTPDEIARQAVGAWLQSRTHRANLLSPLYQAEAIAVVLADNAALFITQNFTFQPATHLADASSQAALGQ